MNPSPGAATMYQLNTAPPCPSSTNFGKYPNCSAPPAPSKMATGFSPQSGLPFASSFCAQSCRSNVDSCADPDTMTEPSGLPCTSAIRKNPLGKVIATPSSHKRSPDELTRCKVIEPSS